MTRRRILTVVMSVALVGCGGDGATGTTTTTPVTTTAASVTTDASAASVEPASTAPSTVAPSVAADVAYAPVSDAQRLDLFVPTAGAAPYPLVVLIHGGAWMTGDKRAQLPAGVIPSLLGAGYAAASINYRLSNEETFPAQILDAKAAIRYLRAHALEYQLDPERFAAVGESAGGHLAALLGTSAGVAAFDDAALGNGGVSSSVQAVVDFYGPVDLLASDRQLARNPACAGELRPPGEPDPAITQLLGAPAETVPELAATANPLTYLNPARDVPPFFIAHGEIDCVVPYQQSVELHDAIDAVAPGRSQLVIVPGSGHYTAFDFDSQAAAVLAFLAATIGS